MKPLIAGHLIWPIPLQQQLDMLERELIRRALTQAGGHLQHAADIAGMWRSTLLNRMAKYGMRVEEFRGAR